MASRTSKPARKGNNGTGDSLTVMFDKSDPAERRALEAARLLATKHGRRKSAIIALLEAVYSHYETTGELLSSSEITSALMGQGAPGRAQVGFTAAIAQAHGLHITAEGVPMPTAQDVRPSARRAGRQQSRAGVEIVSAGKVSAQDVAANFLSSMQDLASGSLIELRRSRPVLGRGGTAGRRVRPGVMNDVSQTEKARTHDARDLQSLWHRHHAEAAYSRADAQWKILCVPVQQMRRERNKPNVWQERARR